jgi:hypothetical protein
MDNTDYSKCPICHGPNACSMANANNEEKASVQCWCMDIEISREILDSLNQDFDKSCICINCASRANSTKRL